LDYQGKLETGAVYRFLGGFESAKSSILWVKNENLTIPVMLEGAQLYTLPVSEKEESFKDFTPQKIRWNKVASLTEGAKVFVGGSLLKHNDRWVFSASKEQALLLIFYDESDDTLTARTIRAGRHKNEYWNELTPYSLIAGFFCLFIVAMYFLSRPIFRFTAITAFIALFTPLLPFFPPGVLFTAFYRRLWHKARVFRAYRDILRLPLKYMSQGEWTSRLPDNEHYGAVYFKELPSEKEIPLLIPEKKTGKKEGWYVFGLLPYDLSDRYRFRVLPQKPADPFAPFGAVLGDPEIKAKNYTKKAYILELIACIFLFAGIGINIFLVVKMVFN
jgi:hypothetical protein